MMVQHINIQVSNTSAVKEQTNSNQAQSTDEFRSMLHTAAQKAASQSKTNGKDNGDGKTAGKTPKKDSQDKTGSAQADTAQAAQSALQQAASAVPNNMTAAVLKGTNVLLPVSGQQDADVVQELQGENASASTIATELLSGETEQTSGILSEGQSGKLGAVISDQADAASVTAQTAHLNSLKDGETNFAENSSQADSVAQVKTAAEQKSVVFAAAADVQDAPQTQTSGTTSFEQKGIATEGTMVSDSVKANATKDFAAQDSSKNLQYADENGMAVAANSVSDLYSSGNVVIRISGDEAKGFSSPIHQVANTVVDQLQNGQKEFTMELYPQSLGKISVKLTSHAGLLTVEIAAANPKTQSLILSGSAEIRNILQASTGQNVQTVMPNQQAAQWYGQPQDGGGSNSGNRRQKQEEPNRRALSSIETVSAELNTGDFLSMMQQISAYVR